MQKAESGVDNAPQTNADQPIMITHEMIEGYLYGGGWLHPNAPASGFLNRLKWVRTRFTPRYKPGQITVYQMSSSQPDQEDTRLEFADQPPPSPECYANQPIFFGNKDDDSSSVCSLDTSASAISAQQAIDTTNLDPSSSVGYASQPAPENPSVPSIAVTPPEDDIRTEHRNAEAREPEHDGASDRSPSSLGGMVEYTDGLAGLVRALRQLLLRGSASN